MQTFRINENEQIVKVEDFDGEEMVDREYSVGKNSSLQLIMLSYRNHTREAHIHVRLADRGAKVEILGCIIAKGDASLTLHTFQHHQAADTQSNLLIKGVLEDTSRFSYDGGIRVERVAQKTDAYQRNENLLLSKEARALSKPSLEILADDVRCTHGATVGSLDKDQLWYLASRGIEQDKATKLIVAGFLTGVLGRVWDENIKKKLSRIIIREI